MTKPSLLSALAHVLALGIAQRDAYGAPFGDALTKQVIQEGKPFVQEDRRIDDYVDVLAGVDPSSASECQRIHHPYDGDADIIPATCDERDEARNLHTRHVWITPGA